ncbi:hypothetical protein RCH06_001966 [Polaromonas sp. CG_9.5]|uniref:hypothetical protein n=1 Tax=Polaromonas sp. CG_9.5 TaxID=3071705 RepID=UPI002DFEAE2E|nr:hypothetical protein [Polaromonas sp. CG_9.5]
MAPLIELTPQERLAISRRAIIRHMNRHSLEVDTLGDEGFDDSDEPRQNSVGTMGIIKHAMRVWWHRNPASTAVELASPLLDDYAKAHPFKLISISAGVGAAVVVIRPWRMVSTGTLLAAAIKSSGLTSALISMLSSVAYHPQNTDKTP